MHRLRVWYVLQPPRHVSPTATGLYCATQPSITASTGINISCWNGAYPGLTQHFAAASLDPKSNNWNKVGAAVNLTTLKHSTGVRWQCRGWCPSQLCDRRGAPLVLGGPPRRGRHPRQPGARSSWAAVRGGGGQRHRGRLWRAPARRRVWRAHPRRRVWRGGRPWAQRVDGLCT